MSYTEEQYDAMTEENTPFDAEALHDNYMSSHGDRTKVSRSDIKSAENQSAFKALTEEMDWGTPIDLEFIIDNRCPYYKFFSVSSSETKRLYLNRQIINYIYNHLEDNNAGSIPTDYVGATNAGENYTLHLLKRDRQNGKLVYDAKKGYYATYNRITINYGSLLYDTPEELYAKLDSL